MSQQEKPAIPEGALSSWSRFQGLLMSPTFALAAVLLISLIARGIGLADRRLRTDSTEYLVLAQEIADGSYFKADYPLDDSILYTRRLVPLYPMLIAGVSLSGLATQPSGYLVALLADLLAVWMAFRIGKRISGMRGAWMAGLMAASSLMHLMWATEVLTESLFGFWLLAAVDAVMIATERRTIKAAAWAGACAAFTYLTREIGFFLVGTMALTAAVWMLLPGRPAVKIAARMAAFALLAFIIVASPFWLNVRYRTGSWGLSMRTGVVDQFRNMEQMQHPDNLSGALTASDVLRTLKSRVALAGQYAQGFVPKLSQSKFKVGPSHLKFLGLLWLLGYLWVERRLRRPVLLILGWALAYFLATVFIGPYKLIVRYNYPVWVLLELAMAISWAEFPVWLATRNSVAAKPRAALLAGPALTGLLAAILLAYAALGGEYCRRARLIQGPDTWSAGIEDVCRIISERYKLPERPRVMDRKPFSAYYWGGTMTMLPDTTAEVDSQVRDKKIDIVIIDSMMVHSLKPQLASLVSGLDPPAGMKTLASLYLPSPLMKVITVYIRADYPIPAGQIPVSAEAMGQSLSSGDLWTARRIGDALLQKSPDDVRAHFMMANLEMVLASADSVSISRAEAELQTMERLSPSSPDTVAVRANLEKLKKELDRVNR